MVVIKLYHCSQCGSYNISVAFSFWCDDCFYGCKFVYEWLTD